MKHWKRLRNWLILKLAGRDMIVLNARMRPDLIIDMSLSAAHGGVHGLVRNTEIKTRSGTYKVRTIWGYNEHGEYVQEFIPMYSAEASEELPQ